MTFTKNIPSLLIHKSKKFPDLNSLGHIKDDKVHYLSTNEYLLQVTYLTLGLSQVNLKAKDHIAILASTSMKWHLSDMAILSLGACTIPIYPSYTVNEISFLVDHSDTAAIFIDDNHQLEKLCKLSPSSGLFKCIIYMNNNLNDKLLHHLSESFQVFSFDEILNLGQKSHSESPELFSEYVNKISGQDLATIIYTSGTSGAPKGALITHQSFWKMLHNTQSFLTTNLNESDSTLTFLPLSHVLGRCDSMLNLIFNLTNVYAESLEKMVDNINLVRPTIIIAVPRIFEKIYSRIMNQVENSSLIKKSLFNLAKDVSDNYHHDLDQDLAPCTSLIVKKNLAYNLVFNKIYQKLGGRIRFFVSGGAPLSPDILTFLRNANLTILEGYGLTETIAPCFLNPPARQITGSVGIPIGDVRIDFEQDGEILIKSEAIFSGYYKDSQATEQAFIKDEWFRTGDIGRLDQYGHLHITDRKKDIIITSGGKNVAPQKIENLLIITPYISQAVIVGNKRKYLTAIICLDLEVLKDFEIGLNSLGKIDLSTAPEIINLIDKEIFILNAKLSQFETIKKFYIADQGFSVENGFLTPSLKVKKKLVIKHYAKEIEAMY